MTKTAECGYYEENPLPTDYHATVSEKIRRTVYWTEPGLYIIRFRLLSDPGFPFWDISYCHGRLPTGEYVEVQLPFDQLPRRGWRKAVVWYAKRDKVYAKKLGIFDNVSTLV